MLETGVATGAGEVAVGASFASGEGEGVGAGARKSRGLGDHLAGLRGAAKRRRKAVQRAVSGQDQGRQRDQRDNDAERDSPKSVCA